MKQIIDLRPIYHRLVGDQLIPPGFAQMIR
jgi:hypothetical protein